MSHYDYAADQSLGFFSASGAMKNAENALKSLVRMSRTTVRRYLVRYGAEERGFGGSKGTSFSLPSSQVGKRIVVDLRKSVVDKDNDQALAAKVAATVFHDAIHAARIAGAVGLGLGSYGVGLGQFEAIIPLLTTLGPSLIQLITALFQQAQAVPPTAPPAAPPAAPPSTSFTPQTFTQGGSGGGDSAKFPVIPVAIGAAVLAAVLLLSRR
jgi:hypothetical protein